MKLPWNHLISSLMEQGLHRGKAHFPDMDDPAHLAYLRSLLKETRQAKDLDLPLESLQVLVFDFETTGFYPNRGAEILSIGAVRLRGVGTEEASFYSLVKTERGIPEQIQSLTGITPEALERAPNLRDALRQFLQFTGKRVMVAHYAQHDKRFLDESMWKLYRVKSQHRLFDTKILFQYLHPEWEDFSMESILRFYQVEIGQRHHALSDALMAAQLWRIALGEMMEKGARRLEDVYQRLALLR